ncbi:uncharacterized protein LOC135949148 [Calliphora vicina]|uniref:uncharacterized protein LOC135949148 n=1 Tax=Calliphora vicina TaxID=7373 RepID=UPI00325B9707
MVFRGCVPSGLSEPGIGRIDVTPSHPLLHYGSSYSSHYACTLIKFTNIVCEEFDKSFGDIKECKLKVMGRNKVALRLTMRLFHVPVNNITVNFQLFRKSFDYRPFMYNTTLDFCVFLKNQKRYPFWERLYGFAIPYTNVNHSCPFDHDIIIQDMILSEDMYKNLPLPSGDYKLRVSMAAYNHYKAAVDFFVTGIL